MQQFNPYQYSANPMANVPSQGPNAVSINIIAPQAYGAGATNPLPQNTAYAPVYGQNTANIPIYPQNYNNIFIPQQMQQGVNAPSQPVYGQPMQQMPQQQAQNNNNSLNAANETQLYEKTPNAQAEENKTDESKDKKEEKTKTITPLTDDYVKSLENYLNNDNPKIRLIGAKELLERFKESEDRKDNPSLMPLLNKILKDPSTAVRFLGLTILQTGYAVGNDETIEILKQIQADNQDKIGEDSLLASEILLKLSAPQQLEIQKGSNQ